MSLPTHERPGCLSPSGNAKPPDQAPTTPSNLLGPRPCTRPTHRNRLASPPPPMPITTRPSTLWSPPFHHAQPYPHHRSHALRRHHRAPPCYHHNHAFLATGRAHTIARPAGHGPFTFAARLLPPPEPRPPSTQPRPFTNTTRSSHRPSHASTTTATPPW